MQDHYTEMSVSEALQYGKALSQKSRLGIASLDDRQKKIVNLVRIEMGNKSKGGTVRVF